MAPQSDRSEGANTGTLPRPELNPLINPLLADNMGRWAEVYFKSPPERREEAVIELLRQLEAENARKEPSPASDSARTEAAMAPASVSRSSEQLLACESCGHENPASHQFCGMCGMRLKHGAEPRNLAPPDPRADSRFEEPNRVEQPDRAEHAVEAEDVEPYLPPTHDVGFGSTSNVLSLFQPVTDASDYDRFRPGSSEDFDDSRSHKYRYVIGAILAIVIMILGYSAWRSTQGAQNSQGTALPPPAAAPDTSPAPSTPAAKDASPTSPAESAPETGRREKIPLKGERTSPAESRPARTAAPKTTAEKPAEKAPAAAAKAESGATGQELTSTSGREELSTARRYLNGPSGHDSAEAAKWLWRSVSKHNGEATLLLADLYLKGDGVSKNCDQARILLDSAARRGMPGAAERLRNLQAFGCQ